MDKEGIFLRKQLPIFYSALMLTAVNLLLRAVGTSFQVYLSGRIGATGIGLLQLVMSVGSLAMVAGMGGIRTAAMYLAAGELGRKKPENVTRVLSGCFAYSILFSGTVSLLLYTFAPAISENWIGDARTLGAIRLFAGFLPCVCLCGILTGYFTAANRIGTLAAIEVAEQLCTMAITLALLQFRSGNDPAAACEAVILGSSFGCVLTLLCLCILRIREKPRIGPRISIARPLAKTALPLALADDLKAGISTLENLMVPKRLAMNALIANPLAAFGTVSGMVFPVLMFPACILFGLAELLIPELARCAAADSRSRIRYLVRRSLKAAMLYGLLFCGLMYLTADALCLSLYRNTEAGVFLKRYALLIPMLYCDAITDAMTKGLGQQAACVRYNILTSGLDVVFLYFLLPKYGMAGYFFSFFITHLLNFGLSLQRLLKISGVKIPFFIPAFGISGCVLSIWLARFVPQTPLRLVAYPVLLVCLLYLFHVLRPEDFLWLRGLIHKK